jgi:glutamyl-Q tRNA(Asp) synthetase
MLPEPPLTRFAPAPTGYLHLGHVVNALYVWGMARAQHGRVLLRIEDHDGQRSRPEYAAAILEDLDWLGFRADGEVVRQSLRGPIYEAALDALRHAGWVYACDCTRREIAEATGSELWYPGTCRSKGLAEQPGVGLRVKLPPVDVDFEDLALGPQRQRPSDQCGDVLARDRHGQWTYQFAAAVDDRDQQITLVIRGEDLLESTGRQILLAELLGRVTPPRYLHHPLVMKTATHKLSKSDRDTGVRDLRAAGWTRERVLAEAARLGRLPEHLYHP